ncbi:MAG: metal-dependent hydrolase [Planctomycetota bacterium]
MDSLTHICFGYVFARSTGLARDRRQAAVAAGISALPDLDLLVQPFLSQTARFAFHRGPSHSLLAGIVFAAILLPLVRRLARTGWLRAYLLALLAFVGHTFYDLLTGYGTAVWWPLSARPVAWELVFVVDPVVTVLLLATVIGDLIGPGWARWGSAGVRWATGCCLALVALYITVGGIGKHLVRREFRAHLRRELAVDVQRIHAEPTPLNNQLWYLCAETENNYYHLYRSVWDGEAWESIGVVPRRQRPLLTHRAHPLVQRMTALFRGWFTCLPTAGASELVVVDMRLGRRYGWEDREAPYQFVYLMEADPDGELTWRLRRPDGSWSAARLLALWARVFGRVGAHAEAGT